MPKVAVLANCQGEPIAHLVNNSLDGYHAVYFSNNSRTGGFTSDDDIIKALSEFDILFYQPLSAEHGKISESSLREIFPNKQKISFPFIFNSGISTLSYSPNALQNPYGYVFGGQTIVEMISAGLDKTQIFTRLADGDFTPTVIQRFRWDLQELATREASMDVQVSDFIRDNYTEHYLFLTHNHPTTLMFIETFMRFVKMIEPSRAQAVREFCERHAASVPNLTYAGAPITRYDARAHGYKFGYHSDWRQKAEHLIGLVWRHHKEKQDVKPVVYPSEIIFPDVIL